MSYVLVDIYISKSVKGYAFIVPTGNGLFAAKDYPHQDFTGGVLLEEKVDLMENKHGIEWVNALHWISEVGYAVSAIN